MLSHKHTQTTRTGQLSITQSQIHKKPPNKDNQTSLKHFPPLIPESYAL